MRRESSCVRQLVSAEDGLLYNSSMSCKRSLSAILKVLRQQIALLAARKGVLVMKDSLKPSTEQHLRNLQGSLKGNGALKALVDERQKEIR